jgi:hypothetical protein
MQMNSDTAGCSGIHRTAIMDARACLYALFFGLSAFLLVTGGRILDPSNISWLAQGDPATSYLGWAFFADAPWGFPLGANPDYGLELGSSIVYSDSIPLLALVFKLFRSLLPRPFQFLGLWLALCFVLQSYFGYRLTSLITRDRLMRAAGTVFFVFCPPLLWRLHGHYALFGQWLVLASIYLYLSERENGTLFLWLPLIGVSALVHCYLFVMVAALWVADLLRRLFFLNSRVKRVLLECFAGLLTALIVMWLAGYFMVGPGAGGRMYGQWPMNLLTFFDPSGWSYVLQDLPESTGNYEGFGYLGLGLAIGLVLWVPHLSSKKWSGRPAGGRSMIPLAAILFLLLLIALSNRVTIGGMTLQFGLSDKVDRLLGVFRASGRFLWPSWYFLAFLIILGVTSSYGIKRARVMLLLLAFVQIADTSAGWIGFRERYGKEASSHWVKTLKSDFWPAAATQYKKIRSIPSFCMMNSWDLFAYYAYINRMATDIVYLSRIDTSASEHLAQIKREMIATGEIPDDTLFVLSDEATAGLISTRANKEVFTAKIDGVWVVAPMYTGDRSAATREFGSEPNTDISVEILRLTRPYLKVLAKSYGTIEKVEQIGRSVMILGWGLLKRGPERGKLLVGSPVMPERHVLEWLDLRNFGVDSEDEKTGAEGFRLELVFATQDQANAAAGSICVASQTDIDNTYLLKDLKYNRDCVHLLK